MKHLVQKVGLCAAIPLLMLSCSDDPFGKSNSQSDREMCFTTQMAESSSSRGTNGKLESFTAEKCENSDIYLITTIEDGIDGTKLDSYDKDAEQKMYESMSMAQSRAEQLTASSLVEKYLKNGDYGISLYGYKYPSKDSYNSASSSDYKYSDVIAEFGADSLTSIVKFINGERLAYESKSSDGNTVTLSSSTKHYWDAYNVNRMTFFGLFPSVDEYSSVTSSTTTASFYNVLAYNSYVKFKYYMDTDPAKQIDFLYAQTNCLGNGSSYSNKIALNMQHIMCGINVTLGDNFDGYYITEVRFDNSAGAGAGAVNAIGTFDMAKGEWEIPNPVGKYTRAITYSCDVSDQKRSLDGTLFMVIPQKLGQAYSSENNNMPDCYIHITVKNPTTNATETYNKDISGTEWPQGKTVNYQLSKSPDETTYFITTEHAVMKYGRDGNPAGNGTSYTSNGHTINDVGYIRVKSYKRIRSNINNTIQTSYETVPWAAYVGENQVVSSDDSNVTSSLSESYATDYNTYTGDDAELQAKDYNFMFKYSIGAQTQTSRASTETKDLNVYKNHTPIGGTASDADTDYNKRIDLSLRKQVYADGGSLEYWYKNSAKTDQDAVRETANCYMVRYPGYYLIPCVYGNAVHWNNDFTTAYKNISVSGNDLALNNMVRHDDVALNGNWINSNSCGSNPDNVVSIWQDQPNLVTDLQLYNVGAMYFIKFTVPQANMKPGNAVIAVRNSSNVILWSWHIWITPWARTDRFSADPSGNASMTRREFLKVPLGFVERDTLEWKARETVLTLKQKDGDGNIVGEPATIKLQQDLHLLPQHSCCYYQWGRPVPFPGAVVTETSGAMAYDGTYTTTISQVPLYNLGVKNKIQAKSAHSTIGLGIQEPYYYFSQLSSTNSNAFPYKKNYVDLWGCAEVTSSFSYKTFSASVGVLAKKTIYDPCPIELKVPPIHAFPRLTLQSENLSTTASQWASAATNAEIFSKLNSPFNSVDDFLNKASMVFYCNKMSTTGDVDASGGTYDLPALGYIDSQSSSGKTAQDVVGDIVYQNVGERGWYWSNSRGASSTEAKDQFVFNLRFGYIWGWLFVEQVYGNTECIGEPILPMYDEYNPVY